MKPTTQLAGHLALLSLIAVGGVNSVLPDIHRYVVDLHHWLTDTEFASFFAIAQAAPGPNLMIVTLIGWKVGGLAGAATATAAICAAPCALAFVVAGLWRRFRGAPWQRAIQMGLAPLTVGLVLATAYVLTRASDHGLVGYAVTGVTAAIVLTTRLHPLWLFAIAAGLGAIGLV
jgi:chromate transporter